MGGAGFQYAGPKEEPKELSRRRGELLEQLRTLMRRVEDMCKSLANPFQSITLKRITNLLSSQAGYCRWVLRRCAVVCFYQPERSRARARLPQAGQSLDLQVW
jgi:hypothetical protein